MGNRLRREPRPIRTPRTASFAALWSRIDDAQPWNTAMRANGLSAGDRRAPYGDISRAPNAVLFGNRRHEPFWASAAERDGFPKSTRGRARSRLTRSRTGGRMSQYPCYMLDGRQTIVSVDLLDAATDDEARHEARWLFFDRGTSDGSFELWLRDRLVERPARPLSVY